MTRTSRVGLEMRKRDVLRHLHACMVDSGCEVSVSLADLAKALNITKTQVRYTVGQLEREGLIRRQMCFRDDGGQMACSFCVTRRGRAYLGADGCALSPASLGTPLPQGL